MANKKIQYQAVSRTLLIPVAAISVFSSFSQPSASAKPKAHQYSGIVSAPFIPAQTATPFTQFTPNTAKKLSPALYAHWINTPAQIVQPAALFSPYSQPIKARYTVFDESQSVFYPPEEPPAPPFIGFSRFEGIIKARLNIAPFSNFNFVPFTPVVDTHDGVFVKRKRKRIGPDPIELEIEERNKRRAALELAVYGPPVEITADLPSIEPVAAALPPNVEDLTRIVMAARQAQAEQARLAEAQADEDDLEAILREIL